jgi:hypothetical protein
MESLDSAPIKNFIMNQSKYINFRNLSKQKNWQSKE